MASPKTRFQESKENVAFWLELVTKRDFLRGLDAAQLQMQYSLPDSDHTETSVARFHRIMGAEMFREILLNLPEITKERTPLPDINLRQVGK